MASMNNQSPQEGLVITEHMNMNNIPSGSRSLWNVMANHSNEPLPPNMSYPALNPYEVNGNVPFGYSPAPNFVNVPNPPPYSRYPYIQNGVPTTSTPRIHNLLSAPVLVQPPRRPSPYMNSLATPQNIQLIQSGWNKTSGGVKKPKRFRTAFTSNQMTKLEQEYGCSRYLDRTRRLELANLLRLNERTIKIWFQNRRMKEKKDRAESVEREVEHVTTTQSSAEAGLPILQERYQVNYNETYSRMGITLDQHAVPPAPTLSSMAEARPAIPQGSYPLDVTSEEYPIMYRQGQFQGQQYPSLNGECRLPPELTLQSDNSVSVTTSTVTEVSNENCNMSWLKNLYCDEED